MPVLILPQELVFIRRETLLGRLEKKVARAENKPSSVPFDPAVGGTQGDDHLSGSFVAKGFKRPTRKLSFAFSSRRVLCLRLRTRRATSYSHTWSCSQVGFTQACVTTGTGGLLHHLFTLTLRSRQRRDFEAVSFLWHFPSLQDESLRAHALRGALPWRARTFLPSTTLGAIIYSALAILTDSYITFLLNASRPL